MGNDEMQAVAASIREGSEAYVAAMFGTIFKLLLPMTVVILILYAFREGSKTFMVTLAFVAGAVCSSLSGVIGMYSSTRANARVANTSCEDTFRATIIVALRSGAIAGIMVVSLAVFGISFLFSIAKVLKVTSDNQIPNLLVGFGFGASFVAMFAQLGGGIYTKAADVGADLCGKVELGIPEDDPRNPAVIADLVGDNVGDCCARDADLFESLSAEIIAAMILGSTLTQSTKPPLDSATQLHYMLFPLVVHVVDLIVSTLGILSVRRTGPLGLAELEDPMTVLKRGY